MISEQQAFIHRYLAYIWNKKDLSFIKEACAENIVIHSSFGEAYGPEKIIDSLSQWYAGFPDTRLLLLGLFELEDRIALQWTVYGTHQGTFLGVEATFLPIKCGGTSIYRFANGKVVEYWSYINLHDVFQQLNGCQDEMRQLTLL